MGKYKHFLWFQLPAIVYAVAIFIQSSLSSLVPPNFGFKFEDKLFHALEYAILGILIRRAFTFQGNQFVHQYAGLLTILTGGVYAMSDEIHQSFVPGRFSDVYDVIADIIGIVTVVVYYNRRQIRYWWARNALRT